MQDLSVGWPLPPERFGDTARNISPQRMRYKFAKVFCACVHQPEVKCCATQPDRFRSAISVNRRVEVRNIVFSQNIGNGPGPPVDVAVHRAQQRKLMLKTEIHSTLNATTVCNLIDPIRD